MTVDDAVITGVGGNPSCPVSISPNLIAFAILIYHSTKILFNDVTNNLVYRNLDKI
ncbi:hypothetical protein NFHSH190041_18910 [Shewanella sp. NFH-SH190041]|nr:hypothetical protein NFHSH190041_18910 [Shewanella sp. NFH-SH190041]